MQNVKSVCFPTFLPQMLESSVFRFGVAGTFKRLFASDDGEQSKCHKVLPYKQLKSPAPAEIVIALIKSISPYGGGLRTILSFAPQQPPPQSGLVCDRTSARDVRPPGVTYVPCA